MKNKTGFLLLIVGLLLGFGSGIHYDKQGTAVQGGFLEMVRGDRARVENSEAMKTFWEAWDMLKKEYAGPLDENKLIEGATAGMVDAVGDPYTVFLNAEENKSLTQELDGVFGGIGAEIGFKDEYPTIVAPLKGSPAEKSGLSAGDRILEVDGKVTKGMSAEEIIRNIRGEKGTKVKLKIMRGEDRKDFEITRDIIVDHTVKWEMKDNVAYLEISQFKNDTAKELNDQVPAILAKAPRGLVLDLRNNPGGSLDAVVDVAGRFLKEGDTVLIEKPKNGPEKEDRAKGNQSFAGIKTVVLVNEGSASASEILAGALKDYGLATVVGKTTFGKGLMQGVNTFDDGSALKVTVAEWLTPKRNSINETGIKPDVEVEYTEVDYKANRDPQLEKALELLK